MPTDAAGNKRASADKMLLKAASNWRETRQNGLPNPERTFVVHEDWGGRFNTVFKAIGAALTAFRIPAIQARHTPIHHHYRGVAALDA